MNIINRFFIWALLLPEQLYWRMGVDTNHLRAILSTKLLMDDRRVPPMQQMRRKKQRLPRFATLGTMLFSAVIGMLYLLVFSIGSDYITRLGLFFSFYIFMLSALLITDFTTVLIDVRDNLIILPKPVNDKTFLLARLLHIVTHVSKLVLPMTLPATIYLVINEGPGGCLSFILLVVCSTLFAIFLINAVYVLILRFTTPEKFKNIINYFQIFFAILVYGSYQLVPRLFTAAFLENYSLTHSRFAWLLPPYWFAAGWQYLNGHAFRSPLVFYFLLSIGLPVLSLWIVIRFFAPSFNRKLAMIGGSDTVPAIAGSPKKKSFFAGYAGMIASLFCRDSTERMAFLFTWKITARSRDFRMKVYPSIGYLAVYILVLVVQLRQGAGLDKLLDKEGPGKYVFTGLIYISSYSLMMAIYQLVYSEKYKASWIYFITPVHPPGKLLLGALKSVTAKFFIPIALIACVLAVPINGIEIIPNLLLSLCNQWLITLVVGYTTLRSLPFSQVQSSSIKGSNFLRGMFSMVLPMLVAFIHFLAYNNLVVIIILLVLSAIAVWLMADALKSKSWEQVNVTSYE